MDPLLSGKIGGVLKRGDMEEERVFNKIPVNKYQTEITEELLSHYPEEVQKNFWDIVMSVPFVKNLISPNRQYAKDRPRDEKGRIIVDLANPHILEDMDYFRPSAIKYERDGRYTDLKPNKNPNSPYGRWLREEIRRCWEGYVRPSDGEWVTGYMYFYLNYVPMMVTKADKDTKKKRASRVEGFPDVWEATYWRFHYIDQARNGGMYNDFAGGNHAAELSKRGSGKSFSLAAIMAHNLLLGESREAHKRTTTILTAYLREYLAEKDGTFSKFVPIKSFLAEHTQFPRRMLTDSPNKMSWRSGYKDKLTGAEVGDQNILLGLSSKDDVGKIRGKRGYILFEEFGSFLNLIDIYNNVRDGMEEGPYVYGLAYLVGTAGDKDSDFHGAQELIYNPKGYNIYALPNNWDRPNQGRPWFAFFTPAYVNLKGYYNKDGVSDIIGGLLFLLQKRYDTKYNTNDPKTIIKSVSNMPITPSEAIIQGGISQFPVTDIETRILEINANPNFYDKVYTGQLTISDNKVEFVPTSDAPIRYFPHKDNKNMAGAVEIFEMPQRDANGDVYSNRYIAGADPYDNDESTTVSLGSIFVLDLLTDRIVAEYTGRPPMADDYFEVCRRLCLFYNARLNYENNKKGLFGHFSTMNSTYLLTDVLEILVDKQMSKPGGSGNTAKGTNASNTVNGWARQLLVKYLNKPQVSIEVVDGQEREVTRRNLDFIKNKALLLEMSHWNPFGNFDRVSAMGMLMLLREDRLRLMGGNYNGQDEEEDPDDILNDEYWTNNFKGDEQETIDTFMSKENIRWQDSKKLTRL